MLSHLTGVYVKDYFCPQSSDALKMLQHLPFNISMSSFSSSAIHLGGELVMGCDVRHNKVDNSWNIYRSGLYHSMSLSRLFNYVVCKSPSDSYSHFYKMQQILKLRALYERLQDNQDHNPIVSNYTRAGVMYNLHCSGHRSGDALSNFSKLSKEDSKSSPVTAQKVFFYGECINCIFVNNAMTELIKKSASKDKYWWWFNPK